MPEMNIERAKGQPKKDEVITLNLDNLEEELNAAFGELDVDDGVEFESRHKEVLPESAENVFLAQNPDVRKVIEETSGMEVEFEGVNDKIADEVKKVVRQKIDASHILLGLDNEMLAEVDLAKNRILSETNLTKLSEDEVEDAAEKLFKKIEAAVTEIEIKHASTN